jgi:long-chain acyl-CoA synthetase
MKFNNLVEMIDQIDRSVVNKTAFNFIQNGAWVNISNKDFIRDIRARTLGLHDLGLIKNMGFGIFANSSPIWLMFNFAAMSLGSVSVPIFPNISTQNLLFEIDNSDTEFFLCDCKENLQALIDNKVKFRKIITFGFIHQSNDPNIINFHDLLLKGDELKKQDPAAYGELVSVIKKSDIATIIYTSGSTGKPKGVEITHDNLVHQIRGCHGRLELKRDSDVALSFLPLAHIFEGMVINFYISKGISIYFVDDVKNIGKLLLDVKPTLMTVVPRMLEKTYNKISEKLNNSSPLKKLIGKLAFKLALNQNPDLGRVPFNFLFHSLVYKKLIAGLGGNLRMMICGGAPLSKDLEQFFNNIGINLFVGYGLTETSPVIGVNCESAHKIGTIGKAFPGVQVRIQNGELLTKSPCVMKGYHKDVTKTKETIDDGWLKTGDLAKIDSEGFITITGRKKELFKTAGGKYVSPVPIEQKLLQNFSLLTAALVVAEGKKCVTCLLFVDFDMLPLHKKKFKLENLSNDQFFNSDVVIKKVKDVVKKVNNNLNDWEKIRKFQLVKDELTIEDGDLTPSMKLKRNSLELKYKEVIDFFYI